MSIETLKLDLAKKIIDTNDTGIINHIKALFDTQPKENWFESLPEDVKISVELGIKQADGGEGTPHSEVMKNVQKWLKK
jgi:predicted transcriptional regulator